MNCTCCRMVSSCMRSPSTQSVSGFEPVSGDIVKRHFARVAPSLCGGVSSIMREQFQKREAALQASTNSNSVRTGESRAATLMREVFESGRPLTYIRTNEEFRVGNVLREVAGRMPGTGTATVWTWSLTEGMHRDGETATEGTFAPGGALEFIAAHSGH